MAKEFLHKHFINEVKGALHNRGGGGSPRFQTKTFTENGVYKADPGYTGFSEIIVEVGGGSVEEPVTIAAGLYETGTNYGTMIASWDELVESGAIVVTDGVVYRGLTLPDNLPDKNEYGFYFDVMYYGLDAGQAFVFHADGSFDGFGLGAQNEVELTFSAPAGTAVYSANFVGTTSGDVIATFHDEANMTFDGGIECSIIGPANFNGDLVFPNDGGITIGDRAFTGCTTLNGVSVLSETPPTIGVLAFYGCTSLTAIKVPASSVDAYKAADGWSEYASIIVPIS